MSVASLSWLILGLVSLTAAIAVAFAEPFSAWLVRARARRLPARLEERLLEEWLAELAHIETRTGRLAFAIQLTGARIRSLVSAIEASDAPEGLVGAVVLSNEQLRIAPSSTDAQIAGLIDVLIFMGLLVGLYEMTGDTALAVWFSMIGAAALWALVSIFVVRVWGATPGMLAAGLRVVTMNGAPLTLMHVVRREGRLVLLMVATALFLFALTLAFVGAPALATMTKAELMKLWDRPLFHGIVWGFVGLSWITGLPKRSSDALEGPTFDHAWSGTSVIYKIPRVVGVQDQTPRGSTSAMR